MNLLNELILIAEAKSKTSFKFGKKKKKTSLNENGSIEYDPKNKARMDKLEKEAQKAIRRLDY